MAMRSTKGSEVTRQSAPARGDVVPSRYAELGAISGRVRPRLPVTHWSNGRPSTRPSCWPRSEITGRIPGPSGSGPSGWPARSPCRTVSSASPPPTSTTSPTRTPSSRPAARPGPCAGKLYAGAVGGRRRAHLLRHDRGLGRRADDPARADRRHRAALRRRPRRHPLACLVDALPLAVPGEDRTSPAPAGRHAVAPSVGGVAATRGALVTTPVAAPAQVPAGLAEDPQARPGQAVHGDDHAHPDGDVTHAEDVVERDRLGDREDVAEEAQPRVPHQGRIGVGVPL